MPRRILLDTDLGTDVDDALCLALALASPEIELVGVTTVGRDSAYQARITARLLRLAGRSDVPVFAGCRVSVLGKRRFIWLGHEGEGILAPGEPEAFESEHGVDALLRLTAGADVEIVAVGPMTNLGVALMKDPDLAARVPQITLMGGHLREVELGGRVLPPGTDYNLCADPEASLVLLRSGMTTRLVPIDVTLRTRMRGEDVDRIEAVGTPFHSALAQALRIWTRLMRQRLGAGSDNAAFLHDPLALACAHDESFCTFEELEVEPAIEERGFRSFERDAASEASRPMRCAVDVDAEAFRRHMVERIAELSVPGSS